MNSSGQLFLGLTAVVAALVGLLVFAVLRIAAAARQATRRLKEEGAETAFMAAALQDALGKLREQERASQARAEASERLNGEIIAGMTSGLLVVGAAGDVRTINPAGRRLLGLDQTGVAGSYHTLLAGAEELADVVDECLRRARPIVRRAVRVKIDRGTGAVESHLGVTVSPITDAAGRPQGAICLFTDLTAIVELEEQLRLKESLAQLGELTAGIAHEFRNGLATIHGYGRLIDPDQVPSQYRACVLGIRQETQELSEMVANFLNFAKPTALNTTRVDLRAVAERALSDVRTEADRLGGDVRLLGEFGYVEADEVLLRQAFSNLCRNALEACANARVPPRIDLEGAREVTHGAVRVTVSDNGPGIPDAIRGRIFRPFFTTKTRGTGLGLALVQKIIVTHGGRVLAAPAGPRGGASIQVVLPLANAETPRVASLPQAVRLAPVERH